MSAARARPSLPPEVHVFVRDWLSANQVVLKGAQGCVIVDTGYAKHVPLTLALVASRMGLDGRPLSKLVNTHCHSDHMGGNAALRRAYDCPIAVPAGEAPLIEIWDERTLLLGYADQRAERFAVDEVLLPGATYSWGDLEWRSLAAPGHDMGALVFFNDEHRILISGDALWENGYRFRHAAGARPGRAAGGARDAADDRGPGCPLRDPRTRRAVRGRRRGARARISSHGGVRSRSDAHGAARIEGGSRYSTCSIASG